MMKTPTTEELLKKIQKLEDAHNHLKLKLDTILNLNNKNNSSSSSDMTSTKSRYESILESMGQSVHMFDLNYRIVYWNQMSENLYGYTVAEVLGKTDLDIIIGPTHSELATIIMQRAVKGETWSGQFPVRNRYSENFTVITTLSPFCDQNGSPLGVICVSTDARHFQQPWTHINMISSYQPLQTTIFSKISNLASKVKMKTKSGLTNMDHQSDSSTTTVSNEGSEKKPRNYEVLSQKVEEWMGKKGISRRFGWSWLHKDQDQHLGSTASYGTSSSRNKNIDSTIKSDISTLKYDIYIENLDVEISWDDLIIHEPIEQGSHATVYHALWYGSDVAVKMFNRQEYPDDMILSFRKEVFLMKRLRYPYILLFMGAIASPQHMCIVTEFLPRGSLFRLLQHSTTKLNRGRCIRMAMDIARGMNYLHHCQPPIIHGNLKSSNLLVDDNSILKVGDFGLSRIKHDTYLATNTKIGTPHWMAPEVLRNEQVDEKSDVYSYGVVLWEITTRKIPWENFNSIQVIGAVGFMNQRLEIPNDVEPQWASLIESCWLREPQSRPTFEKILSQLRDMQQKFMK